MFEVIISLFLSVMIILDLVSYDCHFDNLARIALEHFLFALYY